eukprot:766240-Hanusia_phi.AAC.1
MKSCFSYPRKKQIFPDEAHWTLPQHVIETLTSLYESYKRPDGLSDNSSLESEVCLDLRLDKDTLRAHASQESFEGYHRMIAKEWETLVKVEALAQHGLLRSIAKQIPGGSPEDPLVGMCGITSSQIFPQFSDAFLTLIEKLKGKSKTRANEAAIRSQAHENAKFCMEEGKMAVFGKLSKFHDGLIKDIGIPMPDLMKGIQTEHCARGDSAEEFFSHNYGSMTTPRQEWSAVTDARRRKHLSVGNRRIRPVDEILKLPDVVKAGLIKEEVLALQLYTGPMFVKYNAVLRNPASMNVGPPPDDFVALRGNKYTTTIFCIVSGIIKLSRVTELPRDRVVYRGFHGLQIPREFLEEDEYGVSGGVELGMMSTTTDMKVALQYATRGDFPTVFEIACGAVDRGASLSFLSQYPEEEEILYPPLSYLELIKKPRTRELENGMIVRVLPMKINSNMTCSTIEDILGKRKQLFLALINNIVEDIEASLDVMMLSKEVNARLSKSDWDVREENHLKLRDSITDECKRFAQLYAGTTVKEFNDDTFHIKALKQATSLKKMAINKLDFWLKHTSGDACDRLASEDLRKVYQRKIAHLHRMAWAESSADKDREDAAVEACRMLGLWRYTINRWDAPAVVEAIEMGQADLLPLLKLAGHDMKGSFPQDKNYLELAISMGYKRTTQTLIELGVGLVFETIKTRTTALHVACEYGQVEIFNLLVALKGKEIVTWKDDMGQTCAHLACQSGQVQILKALLLAATETGKKEIVWERGYGNATCAHSACEHGHADALKMVLEVGGREIMAVQNGHGQTCMHDACKLGHVDVLKVLLELGEKDIVHIQDDNGRTCLHQACMRGRLEAVKLVIEAGGSQLVMTQSIHGRTCAHEACEHGHAEVLNAILQVADKELLMCADRDGRTCAHEACKHGHAQVLECMLELGGKELL